MKLSDYVFEAVADAGVEHVFFLPGGGAMHLVDSLGKCERLEPVLMLHEQAAAIAAEAYARVTGNLGVVLVTTGPGGTNALTGVAGAWIESTPLLVISGQVKRADLMGDRGVRQFGPQEVAITRVAAPITKAAVQLLDPERGRPSVEGLLHTAREGRPGPVWLDVPLDVQAAQVNPVAQIAFVPPVPVAVDAEAIATRILEELSRSQRPVILAGNGVRLAKAVEPLRQVVERSGVPLLTSRRNGIDVLPGDHPLYFGRPGSMAPRYANWALQTADLIVVIGCRLDPVQVAYDWAGFGRNARKVMLDIDVHEIAKITPPVDVALVADAGPVLNALAARLATEHAPAAVAENRQRWADRCRDWKARYPVIEPRHRNLSDRVSTYVLAEALSHRLSAADTMVIGSSGAAIETFMLAYSAPLGQRTFLTGGLGAMGFGLPASIGACLGANRGRTVLVDGDGGFQLNIQELATLHRLRLPVKVFVLDNQGYASIRSSQRRHFGHLVGADATSGLELPDITRVAEAYGLRTARVSRHADLPRVFDEVLAGDDPVICVVDADPDEIAEPRSTSRVMPDGSMTSRPLEDLTPLLDPDLLMRELETWS